MIQVRKRAEVSCQGRQASSGSALCCHTYPVHTPAPETCHLFHSLKRAWSLPVPTQPSLLFRSSSFQKVIIN